METHAILWPAIAMATLIWVIWASLFIARVRHMKKNPPTAESFKDGPAATRYFLPVEMPSNNLRNLVEMPMLFFGLVPLLIVSGMDSSLQIGLAWLYVLLRCWHSYEHVVTKKVRRRFLVYVASCAVLSAMWIGFVFDLALTSSR